MKNLDYWPSLPLVVNYGGFPMHPSPSPEDEDNIIAALKQSHRVCSISLTVTSSLLKILSTISEPFSELEELVLLSRDNVQLTLSSTFLGHRLRTLHSTRIAIPSLPQLLLPSRDLVDLQLHEIPGIVYFSPEAFANALQGMTQLEILSLHFLHLPPRRSYLSLPPPPGDRVDLPALTCFKYRGTSKYLDSLVARIDAPRLGDIDIKFFGQPTLDASQLGLFINRIEMQRSPLRAEILSSRDSISVTFTQPRVPSTRFGLQVSCEQLDWQLSSISQICDHFSSLLISVEDLGVKTIGPSNVPDDMDDELWLRLIRTFDGIKDFRVAGNHVTDILHALYPADKGHKTVLPSLRNLHVQEPSGSSVQGPLQDSVESFVIQRRLLDRPVIIYYVAQPSLPIQCRNVPPLPEDRFKALFTQFANTTGLRLNDRDFIIDGRPVSPWGLHRAVFARNGFDSATANDEWPAVGAALGFPPYSAGDPTQPLRCAPNIAHRLKQLYNDSFRHFEQAYINNAQPPLPTDADYQALLASIPSDTSAMTTDMMIILPRFSHTSAADLEAHRVPPHIVAFVDGHRDNLQRAAQDQNKFLASFTSTKNLPLDNRAQINPAPAFQGMVSPPPQPIPSHHSQLQMLRQTPAQAQANPRAPVRRKVSTKANSIEATSPAPAVASTPTSSTPVGTKGGVKRVREDEAGGTTPGVTSAPSPKKVKPDSKGTLNEEARDHCSE
ncbi:hypothetical protein H4582DRAFT_2075482 [Lactarius indigo]|nr:hypothetical protein H4582DRAFT_2081205 [Lactarius indigo]KAI9440148.1 hypothetical protein H4582DRAFT_2075482 [Lactarius indigo]